MSPNVVVQHAVMPPPTFAANTPQMNTDSIVLTMSLWLVLGGLALILGHGIALMFTAWDGPGSDPTTYVFWILFRVFFVLVGVYLWYSAIRTETHIDRASKQIMIQQKRFLFWFCPRSCTVPFSHVTGVKLAPVPGSCLCGPRHVLQLTTRDIGDVTIAWLPRNVAPDVFLVWANDYFNNVIAAGAAGNDVTTTVACGGGVPVATIVSVPL